MGDVGKRRHRIRIEQRSTSHDTSGELLTTWALVGERWAEILETPGRELWSAREKSARVPTVFELRFPKDFDVVPSMRAVFDGKYYEIVSVTNPDGVKVKMLLNCDQLVGEPTS
jgi:SPP1 family predicted phage head-tail adaptor